MPWRLVVFEGEARVIAGDKLAAIQKARNPAIDEASLDNERRQFLPAPVTIGVILSPKPNPKAPEMEQLLSAGNVCFNLSHAAFALGFAASWTNRWYGFDTEAQVGLVAHEPAIPVGPEPTVVTAAAVVVASRRLHIRYREHSTER